MYEAQGQTTEEPWRSSDAKRILIVEDHTLLAEFLAADLRSEGLVAEVVGGPTAEDVIVAARSMCADVVLLDLVLGEALSGLTLIGPLRDVGACVLVLSGTTDRLVLATCLEAGAAGFVSKSEGFEVVIEQVLRATRNEPTLSQFKRQELLAELRRHRARQHERLAPLERLTERERYVLGALMTGEAAERIGARNHVSTATVRSQIQSILTKLAVNSQLAAVALAYRAGWAPQPETEGLVRAAAVNT
jgi:DNA-binding NarL/FixJ family response regulator